MKVFLVGFSPDLPRLDIAALPEGGSEAAYQAATAILPGRVGAYLRTESMSWGCHPDLEEVSVATYGETTVLGFGDVDLLEEVTYDRRAHPGRTAWALMMHSVTDTVALLVVARDGTVLRRAEFDLGTMTADSPDPGEGGMFPFEAPFWAGERRRRDIYAYFHPMEYGEAALGYVFGTFDAGSAGVAPQPEDDSGERRADGRFHAGAGEQDAVGRPYAGAGEHDAVGRPYAGAGEHHLDELPMHVFRLEPERGRAGTAWNALIGRARSLRLPRLGRRR